MGGVALKQRWVGAIALGVSHEVYSRKLLPRCEVGSRDVLAQPT